MDEVVILLLAAGASSRMRGADKLLQRVDGEALLRRQARAALATGCRVLVALPPQAGPRGTALDGLEVERVAVADAAAGMGHSIAAGARAAAGVAGLMVVNADMPGLGAAELRAVLDAAEAGPGRIWRGMSASGVPGHPVLFPARLLGDLAGLTGDQGARALIAREGAVLVPLPGDAAVLDLDTPEDWAAWQAGR